MAKVNRLTLIQDKVERRNNKYWYSLYRCECGTEKILCRDNVSSNGTISCGCHKIENAKQRMTTHGLSRTKTYRKWISMHERCAPNSAAFEYYGARGITVCARWDTFENFYADMGTCPEGLTLERINNDGNYEPSNCKWATFSEQMRNKRSWKKV